MKDRFKFISFFSITVIALFLVFILRMAIGTNVINLFALFKNPTSLLIIRRLRFPRFLTAFLAGGTLAIAGLIFQVILRNPLAGPFTLGISSGASFGAVIFLYMGFLTGLPLFFNLIPLGAALGSLLVISFIFFVALQSRYFNTTVIILAGVIISSFFSAFITFFIALLSNKSHIALSWMMGNIPSSPQIPFLVLYPLVLILIASTFIFSRELDIFYLGDHFASNLGVNTGRIKITLFILASLVTSIIVSQTGVISFVGIVIPHILRNIIPPSFKKMGVFSFLWGGVFLVFCDVLSQAVPMVMGVSSEIPIGAVTALIGTPIFVYLLLKKKETYVF